MSDEIAATRRPAHTAVEAALRHIAAIDATTTADAMLRTFLTFKRTWTAHQGEEDFRASTPDVDRAGAELTCLNAGSDQFRGSIALRGERGRVRWLRNDSTRGSLVTYARPGEKGNVLFEEGEDGQGDWHRPLKPDAAELVAGAQLGRGKPARDALAAIFLRDSNLDPSLTWPDLVDETRKRLGLTEQELQLVTADPVLGAVNPFDGDEWNVDQLSSDLSDVAEQEADAEDEAAQSSDIPPLVAAHVARVVSALKRYGRSHFVALVGVPGTSKTHVARLAAREFASGPECVCELQFSPGYTYEQFVQGMRFEQIGKARQFPGIFLELNERANLHPDRQYVMRIEEFSRADLPRVLGELLTYVEYRGEDDRFLPMYDRDNPVRVAPNLAFLVTYNPADHSAVNLDDATMRRVRRLAFPPDIELLEEMLTNNGLPSAAISQLKGMFGACRDQAGFDRFDDAMPFGHAIFNEVHTEEDLHDLWHQSLKGMLLRPRTPEHELYQTIRDNYPWHRGPHVRASDGGPQLGAAGTPVDHTPAVSSSGPTAAGAPVDQ